MEALAPDRGYWTKTPNRVLEKVAIEGAGIPGRYHSIFAVLMRETAGYRQRAVKLSQGTIARRAGCSVRAVRDAIVDFERWRVVRRHGAGQGRIAIFEILEPKGWRIGRTAGAVRRQEARRRDRGGDQLLLPFEDVASVFELPTKARVTSRDTSRGIPRGWVESLFKKKRKKEESSAKSIRRDRIRPTLSRHGDRMPDDDPQETTSAEDRAKIRRRRAARLRITRLGLGDPFDQANLDSVAAELSDADVAEEIERREEKTALTGQKERLRREQENMRHEGRG